MWQGSRRLLAGGSNIISRSSARCAVKCPAKKHTAAEYQQNPLTFPQQLLCSSESQHRKASLSLHWSLCLPAEPKRSQPTWLSHHIWACYRLKEVFFFPWCWSLRKKWMFSLKKLTRSSRFGCIERTLSFSAFINVAILFFTYFKENMSGGFAQCDSSWVVKTDYSFFLWVIHGMRNSSSHNHQIPRFFQISLVSQRYTQSLNWCWQL